MIVNTIRSNGVTFIWSNPIRITPLPGLDYRLPVGVCSASCVIWYKTGECFVKRKSSLCLFGIRLNGLIELSKIETKNEALHRQTVGPKLIRAKIVATMGIGRLFLFVLCHVIQDRRGNCQGKKCVFI